MPSQIEHPKLGALTYDDKYQWWVAQVPFDGVAVTLQLDAEGALSPGDADAAAEALEALDGDALKRIAADELLELHNDTWRDEGPEIDPETFMARMTPTSITIGEDRSVTVWFDDGDLFWGHEISVALDEQLRLRWAEMAG